MPSPLPDRLHTRLQTLLDKAEISDLIQRERAARDQAQWAQMRDCYHDDSQVDISWFQGSGPEFVQASRQQYEAGIQAGKKAGQETGQTTRQTTALQAAHQMLPSIVTLNHGVDILPRKGQRALAQTPCTVCVRTHLGGVQVDVTTHTRLHQRLLQREGVWRIARLGIVYLRDSLTPVNPCEPLVLDAAALASYRPSYRFLSLLLAHLGHPPRPDLPGTDRPETVQPLLDADRAWLLEA